MLPNGLFWTQSIPSGSFFTRTDGRWARLILRDLPIPDTFFYANNVSVSAAIDVDVTWRATSGPVSRGFGSSVAADDFGAFSGEFRDATCTGRAGGRETGFNFITNTMSADSFWAQMGPERNGVYL